jgi:hypothetical protein
LHKYFQSIRLELNEFQTQVEPRWPARWQSIDPDHFRRVRDGRRIRQKELHLQELTHVPLFVTENTKAAQADVDGLTLARKKLHPCWPAIERRPNASELAAVGRRPDFEHHLRRPRGGHLSRLAQKL